MRNLYFIFFIFYLIPVPSFSQQGTTEDTCSIIAQIIILGDHQRTRKEIILREMNVKEGDCLSYSRLPEIIKSNELRLMNLQLFNEVKISFIPEPKDSGIMYINTIERFPIMPDANFELADRNFNVWWNEMDRKLNRLNLGLGLVHNNIRGNKETISIAAQVGYTQKAGIAYHRPYFDKDQKHGLGFSFSGIRNREIAYKTDGNKLHFYRSYHDFMLKMLEMSTWYTFRPNYAITHKAGVFYNYIQISDTISILNPDYLGSGAKIEHLINLFYRFEYNGVDNWNYPLKGKRIIGLLEQNIGFKQNSSQTSIHFHTDIYNKWSKKFYTSLIFRARISAKEKQPYILRKNLGYNYDYIRGYEYYVIDGSAFALLRGNLKYEIINLKVKLPVKYFQVVPLRVYAKIYGDVGVASNRYPVNDFIHDQVMYSYGVGLDIVTLYDIKVRIEYTINRMNEKGLYLHRSGE